MTLKTGIGLALVATLALGACGGDDGKADSSTTTNPARAPATAPAGNSTTTSAKPSPLPTSSFKTELVETKSKLRVFNAYAVNGKATAIDLYWADTQSGEKFATIQPGKLSDTFAVKLPKSSAAQGRWSMTVMPAGETDRTKMAQQLSSDDWTDGEERIVVIGTEKAVTGQSAFGARSTQLFVKGGKVAPIPEPPAGKVAFYSSNVGLAALQPKDFVVPGVTGKCFNQGSGGGGNAGAPHIADPGALEVSLFDANTNCKTPLGTPIKITAAAGEKYLLFGYGETEATRQTFLLKL